MHTHQLTPLPAPPLPSPGSAVMVDGAPIGAVEEQVERSLALFGRAFRQVDENPTTPALVVATSGSTGRPKKIVLCAGALQASADATSRVTDCSSAQWLLALPVHYVAGAQVLARSVLAGTRPVLTRSIAEGTSFSARDFVDSAERLTARERLVSLVPTQLHRLLETPDVALRQAAVDALRSFSAVLLGGAPSSAQLIATARQLHLPVIRTYGSAETAGGCVYEATPLPGVCVQIEPAEDTSAPGRIWLGGPTIASGYAQDPQRTAAHFFIDPSGTRWYRTDDLGSFDAATGRLTVQGRSDDVLISGGIKTSARQVATALESHPLVQEALVFGLPDPRWGQVISAAVTLAGANDAAANHRPENLDSELMEWVAQQLGPASAPKLIDFFPQGFPILSTGKPDRKTVKDNLATRWASRTG
ncbi:AMP-binding protein [Rothia sp. P5766]|uniref:AMP-binding protein n=1 Tax=Rothia sp. P5766 TaxID=3402656 RepID=UPI003AE8C4B1